MEAQIAMPPSLPQASAGEARRFWSGAACTAAVISLAFAWFLHSPNQDHIGAIPMNGDSSWYYNYEINYQTSGEMQDPEILYDGIGHSIENAQQADIIFVGWSRVLFGLDYRVADQFAQQRHLKVFNLGFAGISSGEFPLKVAQKWHLRPKLWVINADRDETDYRYGFFHMALDGSFLQGVVRDSWLTAYKNVVSRNIRWRFKYFLGELHPFEYRSAVNGSWNLDNWPFYRLLNNAPITLKSIEIVNGRVVIGDRSSDTPCPALPEEITEAKDYLKELGSAAVLIQIPSEGACAQRVHEIADALGVSAFTVDPTQYSTVDGGGHLDGVSAHKWSTQFFDWLAQTPDFQRAFPNNVDNR